MVISFHAKSSFYLFFPFSSLKLGDTVNNAQLHHACVFSLFILPCSIGFYHLNLNYNRIIWILVYSTLFFYFCQWKTYNQKQKQNHKNNNVNFSAANIQVAVPVVQRCYSYHASFLIKIFSKNFTKKFVAVRRKLKI